MAEPLQASVQYLILFGLFILDYFLGNGIVDLTADLIQKLFCKVLCFTKKVVLEESKKALNVGYEKPVSFPVLFVEMAVLTLTIVILNKYKKCRGVDKIDELLDESKEALRQTNEFLEKWRLRRINQLQNKNMHWQPPKDNLKPLKIEIPILQMAIVDSFGATRSLERGDAGDSANITDSAILSVTSMDDEFESIPDPSILDDIKNDFNNHYLWNVAEEPNFCERVM